MDTKVEIPWATTDDVTGIMHWFSYIEQLIITCPPSGINLVHFVEEFLEQVEGARSIFLQTV